MTESDICGHSGDRTTASRSGYLGDVPAVEAVTICVDCGAELTKPTDPVTATYQVPVTFTFDDDGNATSAVVESMSPEFLLRMSTRDGSVYQTQGDTHFEVDGDGEPLPDDCPAADEARARLETYHRPAMEQAPVRWYHTTRDASSLTIRLQEGIDVEWGEVLGSFFDGTGPVTLHLYDGTEVVCEFDGVVRPRLSDGFEHVDVTVIDPDGPVDDNIVDRRLVPISDIHTITI